MIGTLPAVASGRRTLPHAFLLVIPMLLQAFGLSAGVPAPVTDLERAAVELATVYLSDGPGAWLPRLDPRSPFSSLPPDRALLELESRAGPPSGSRWVLQTVAKEHRARFAVFTIEFPSGVDDTLVMELTKDGEGYRLFGLTSLVEARSEESAVSAHRGPTSDSAAWLLAFALLPMGVFLVRSRRSRLVPILLASVLLAGLACKREEVSSPAEVATVDDHFAGLEKLAHLLDLRRQLTNGEGPQDDRAAATKSETERLWLAQWHLVHNDSRRAERLLAETPSSSMRPLAGLLRARLALLQSQEVDTVMAFEQVFATLPDFDGLHLEAAQSLELMGFEARSFEALGHLDEIGSRNALAYYAMARNAVVDGDRAGALAHLSTAWELEPIERSAFLADPVLVSLSDSPQVTRWLRLDEPDEPHPRLDGIGRREIPLPEGAKSSLNGSRWLLEIDDSEIVVPYGLELAPPYCLQSDPLAIRSHREADALARLDRLRAAGAKGLAQPALRRDMEAAAAALARRSRWAELEGLTRGAGRENQPLPSWWIQLRAQSLRELDRGAEAQALLLALARDDLSRGRRNPSTFYQLAEHVAADGHYDLAVRLIERANAALPFETNDIRIRRLLLDKRLAADFATLETENFRLHYPRDTSLYIAEQMGELLEKERIRLEFWIPLREDSERIDVDLVAWKEFRSVYSGMLGLFDGRVRVPLAEVRQVEHPAVVALISHEIAHALLDQASDGRAPHWFHEGLAQHVQIQQERLNPIPGYRMTGRFLAFPLLESVLGSYADRELVTIAYDEAAWTLHYLEQKHGRDTILELIRSFAEGMDSDAALQEVFGWSPSEFHRHLDRWWQEEAPELWTPPDNPYGDDG